LKYYQHLFVMQPYLLSIADSYKTIANRQYFQGQVLR